MLTAQVSGAFRGLQAPVHLHCPKPWQSLDLLLDQLSFLQTFWKLWRGMATAPTPAPLPKLPTRMGMSARGRGEWLGHEELLCHRVNASLSCPCMFLLG